MARLAQRTARSRRASAQLRVQSFAVDRRAIRVADQSDGTTDNCSPLGPIAVARSGCWAGFARSSISDALRRSRMTIRRPWRRPRPQQRCAQGVKPPPLGRASTSSAEASSTAPGSPPSGRRRASRGSSAPRPVRPALSRPCPAPLRVPRPPRAPASRHAPGPVPSHALPPRSSLPLFPRPHTPPRPPHPPSLPVVTLPRCSRARRSPRRAGPRASSPRARSTTPASSARRRAATPRGSSPRWRTART